MADLQGTRAFLPTLTHASDSPSIKFFSTSRIESLDHRLIAITRLTTNCAGSVSEAPPSGGSPAFLFSFGVSDCPLGHCAERNRLFDGKSWNRYLDCFQYVTTLYIWRHQ